MWSLRARMLELDEQVVYVPGHTESAAHVPVLVSFDGDAGKFVA